MKTIVRFWYGVDLAERNGKLYLLELGDIKYRVTPKTAIQRQQAFRLMARWAHDYTGKLTAYHQGTC